MRKSFLKAVVYFACLAWSAMASALGFGGINVTSSLGQPLSAEIELVAVDKADQSSLNAHLASLDAFKAAGIDYPYSLPKLKFQVETRANGESYIKATTDQPVNEPFVSLLLEVTWSSGRLLREYTFLLDPPGFVPEKPPEIPVQPIAPVVASAVPASEPAPVVAAVPVASAPVPAPVPEPAPLSQPVAMASAPMAATPEPEANAVSAVAPVEAKPVEKAAEAKVVPQEQPAPHPAVSPVAKAAVEKKDTITVKPGDSLSKIALETKEPDVSLERMLVALYRSNEDQFDGKNMNRIKSGKILRQPEEGELGKLTQDEAVKEVKAQVADWNTYRQKLATANTSVGEKADKQEVSGKISTKIAEATPAVKESAKEVLKLSKGEAVGDQTVAGGKEKANAREEDEIAKAKALKDAEQRAAMLEKNIKEMQHLVELKQQAASASASAIPLMPSAVAAASAPASAVAAAKPKTMPAPPKVVPEPSLVDELLANPIALGGGAAAILGLALLGMVQARKRKGSGKKVSPPPVVESIAEPLQEPFAMADENPAEADEVDPIKEADLFLNFGRDVQAEEVLKEALLKDPNNNQIKLKLLSIYETRFDTESFYNYAAEIKQSGDKPAWEQAAAMGLRIDPHNEFYGGTPPVQEVSISDVAEPVVPEKEALDFDAPLPPALDFELDEADLTEPLKGAASEELPVQEISMDFDIGDEKTAGAEDHKLEIPALDIDFSLDEEKPAEPVAEAAPSLNLDDLVFDAPGSEPEPAPTQAPEKSEEFSMDFSLDEPKLAETAEPAKPLGLDDISLDLDVLGAPEAPAAADHNDERWQEVATKLDLARAYQEMGDQAGAREILEEVVRDGDATQRETAQSLLLQLS